MIRTLDKEMTEITARREKEKAKYEATAADLSKAVSSPEGAIADMQAGKGASFLSVKKGIRKSVAIADALDLSPKNQRSITALLQTDADESPEGDFAFHGDDVIATLQDLEKEFKAKKAEVDQIEGQNKKDVNEEALLKDDELYLKDLTSKCELKAREWDQRSQMRSEEVTALTAALKIIKEGVKDNSAVNKRAFIQHDQDY